MGVIKKKKGKADTYRPGFYNMTPEMRKQVVWCLNNQIKIGLTYHTAHMFCVDINIKGKVHKDPLPRDGYESLEKQYEYYKYYYDKYNEKK